MARMRPPFYLLGWVLLLLARVKAILLEAAAARAATAATLDTCPLKKIPKRLQVPQLRPHLFRRSYPLFKANDRSTGNRSSGHLPPDALTDLYVTEADFMAATKLVQPTAKREGFAMAPDVSWDDIGALAGVRDELSLSVSASDWL